MKSSVKKGARQLLLSDMPTSVSSRHLAQSIFVGMGTRLALAAALSLGAFSAFSLGMVPGTSTALMWNRIIMLQNLLRVEVLIIAALTAGVLSELFAYLVFTSRFCSSNNLDLSSIY